MTLVSAPASPMWVKSSGTIQKTWSEYPPARATRPMNCGRGPRQGEAGVSSAGAGGSAEARREGNAHGREAAIQRRQRDKETQGEEGSQSLPKGRETGERDK